MKASAGLGAACSFVSSALSCRNSNCAYIFLYTRNLRYLSAARSRYSTDTTTRVGVSDRRESLSIARRACAAVP